jgi:hypothetical protein
VRTIVKSPIIEDPIFKSQLVHILSTDLIALKPNDLKATTHLIVMSLRNSTRTNEIGTSLILKRNTIETLLILKRNAIPPLDPQGVIIQYHQGTPSHSQRSVIRNPTTRINEIGTSLILKRNAIKTSLILERNAIKTSLILKRNTIPPQDPQGAIIQYHQRTPGQISDPEQPSLNNPFKSMIIPTALTTFKSQIILTMSPSTAAAINFGKNSIILNTLIAVNLILSPQIALINNIALTKNPIIKSQLPIVLIMIPTLKDNNLMAINPKELKVINCFRAANLNLTAATIPVRKMRLRTSRTMRRARRVRIMVTMRRPARMMKIPAIPTMRTNLHTARVIPTTMILVILMMRSLQAMGNP